MSNPARAEGPGPLGKPPKPSKKKKDSEEGGSKPLGKAIIGKLHIPKKGKKNKEEPEGSKTPSKKSPLPQVKLSDESGKASEDFVKKEADLPPPPIAPVEKEAEQIPATEPDKSESEKLQDAEAGGPLSPAKAEQSSQEDSETSLKTADGSPQPTQKREEALDISAKESEDSDTASMGTTISSPPPFEAQTGHKKECLYKILVIGELGTGKTSIIKRYVHQFFSQHYRATIGVDFALKVLNWDQNTIIRLQLWDIAGQERFGNMTRVYYKEAVGAFIVFDVTRAATFDAVVKWKQDLDAKVQLPDGSPIPCVLLANKCDQQKEGIANSPSKMNEYCEEHKFTGWFETSAKENINIEEAAKTLVDEIVRNDSSNENSRNGARDVTKFPLEASEEHSEGKSCNC